MYTPSSNRYQKMPYRRCGRSGVMLPAISVGLWQNFGNANDYATCRSIICDAFDSGVTHFDLANNYGPPPGSAETLFGEILRRELRSWRDELIIATKAGYEMWPGPYGDGGSRKYLLASLDQSLKRMGVDYVDIFYSHRPDPFTPMQETMLALHHAVLQGKALYAGISNYTAAQSLEAIEILRGLGTPFIIHQAKYHLLDRWVENGLTDVLEEYGAGCIAFSPLAQGVLTNKYLDGIPNDSRAAKPGSSVPSQMLDENTFIKVRALNKLAGERGQTMAQMAIAWLLYKGVTSVLIGARNTNQLHDSLGALQKTAFSEEEMNQIEEVLAGP
jgi:L-glyceraldehyde 3-phosphate reductase